MGAFVSAQCKTKCRGRKILVGYGFRAGRAGWLEYKKPTPIR
jgi:hypothetical protein